MITFQANPINSASIIKLNKKFNIKTNEPVVFAEMSPFSAKDKCTMKKIPFMWGEKRGDSAMIADTFEYLSDSKDYGNITNRFFVLTKQQDDFQHIKPTTVLGVLQTGSAGRDKEYVEFMQVNPFYQYNNPFSDLKNVGTVMLNSVKEIFKNKKLSLYSPAETVEFFEKNGFKAIDSSNSDAILMEFEKGI